jgi:hypothetical protein
MGYSTVYGIHYFETFAPVVNASSLRLLMLYALEHELDLEMCDVDNVFVQADLPKDTVIYMEAPPGMNLPKGYALRLRKALYGLKDSPHHFNNYLDERLRAYDFVPCKVDPCLYIKRNKSGDIVALVGCHVNDLAMVGVRGELDDLKKSLRTKYKIKDCCYPGARYQG